MKQKVKKQATYALKQQLQLVEKKRVAEELSRKLASFDKQNELLKIALRSRCGNKNETTHNYFKNSIRKESVSNNNNALKRSVIKFFPSMPALFDQNSVKIIKETSLHGTFGKINIVKLTNLDNVLASQKVISLETSSEADILAELKIMHAVSGHRLFPYCYGYVKPNLLISQYLGEFSEIDCPLVHTIRNCMGSSKLGKYQWVSVAAQVIEGIQFLHALMILHNDIKSDNVILCGSTLTNVKIIDFGKATLITNPVVYNLSESASARYNEKHTYLAYELRNGKFTKQSVLTDVYSFGYMLKYIGYYGHFDFLYNTGRQMKTMEPRKRLSLSNALETFKEFLNTYSFA